MMIMHSRFWCLFSVFWFSFSMLSGVDPATAGEPGKDSVNGGFLDEMEMPEPEKKAGEKGEIMVTSEMEELPPPAESAPEPVAGNAATATTVAETVRKIESADGEPVSVYVIPVEGPIGKPTLFILRRGIKEANRAGNAVLVLDMNTPGGRLDITLEMMKLLDRFEGDTITYVNNEAISAGAFIASATKEIYYTRDGVIGASAPVTSTGQEIDETMRQKILSYLKARVRAYTEDYPYRSQVLGAMMDPSVELKIDDKVISEKGELLALTASEAIRLYGDPPKPLFGSGIEESLESLLENSYGTKGYVLKEFKVTWSEELAQYMSIIQPILLGIGMLCLFIEFKTPGFGIFGITGIIILLVVFASNYVAGLAGYEPVIIFILGIILIGLELLVFPGTIFFAMTGAIMVLASLIWSMADIWPKEDFSYNVDAVTSAVYDIGIGITIAILGLMILWKYLPNTWIWQQIVLNTSSPDADGATGGGASSVLGRSSLPDTGSTGVAVTDLHPGGEIEVDGKRFQASVNLGSVLHGEKVIVVGYKNFSLLVEKIES